MQKAGERLTSSAVVEILQASMVQHKDQLNNSVAVYTEARVVGNVQVYTQTAPSIQTPSGEGAMLPAVLSSARPVP